MNISEAATVPATVDAAAAIGEWQNSLSFIVMIRMHFIRLIQQKHCFWSISEEQYGFEIAAAATAAAAAAAAKYSYQCKQCKFTSYTSIFKMPQETFSLKSENFHDLR